MTRPVAKKVGIGIGIGAAVTTTDVLVAKLLCRKH